MRVLKVMPARRPGRDINARRARVLALRDGAGRLRRIDPAAQPSPAYDPEEDEELLQELAVLVARKPH